MAKVDHRRLPAEKRQLHEKILAAAFEHFGLTSDGKMFLRSILMKSETTMCARRIQTARELLAGISFEKITRKLRVGLQTVFRVDQWLHDILPGYRRSVKNQRTSEALKTLSRLYPEQTVLLDFLLQQSVSNYRQSR